MRLKQRLLNTAIAGFVTCGVGLTAVQADGSANDPVKRNPYFGQTHQHTGWSFDANIYNVQLGPENAFKHARGDKVSHPWGYFAQLKVPLDFMVVSDHGEYLGVIKMMNDPDNAISLHPLAGSVRESGSDVDDSTKAFYGLVASSAHGGEVVPDQILNYEALRESNWDRMVEIVDDYNDPGTFTTLAGFEWSSQPYSSNLHRNVIFRDTDVLPKAPYTYFDSGDPQDLWAWMDAEREKGATLLAIPHNGNLSQGLMYPDVVLGDLSGDQLQPESDRAAIDYDYAETRMRNEKLTEIIQTKGQSETHPLMSPNDEFADFEIWTKPVAGPGTVDPLSPNNYVREAFKRGMAFEQAMNINPFKYGVVGGGDIHTSIVSHEEYAHTGEHNLKSATPKQRLLQGEPNEPSKIEQGSAGLSCVWAEENTRESIYDAMARKETWATSGSRIQARIFGGYDFTQAMLDGDDWAEQGYAGGVPMGGDLATRSDDAKPTFMIWAKKGPNSGNLDRIQVVKGWVDPDGNIYEGIYNVVWSDMADRTNSSSTDENGNQYDTITPNIGTDHVDIANATYTNTVGAPELKVLWTDPQFDPSVRAFYYLRVLEIPTPRWSTYDASVLGEATPVCVPDAMNPGGPDVCFPETIQERAWTSPIWYTPSTSSTSS